MVKQVSFLCSLILTFIILSDASARNCVVDLKCEQLIKPIGVNNESPRLNWSLEKPILRQCSYQIIVGTDSADVLRDKGNMWVSDIKNSSKIHDLYRGKTLQPYGIYYWKVKIWDETNRKYESNVSLFEMGNLNDEIWTKSWITDSKDINLKPSALFRKDFHTYRNIKQARAYIATTGLYELYINGKKVGNHRLSPAFTRYDKRVSSLAYDVTDYIKSGDNAVGVSLGNGWYNLQSIAVWGFENAQWRGRPKFCLNIRIVYDDDSIEWISTEDDWKTSLGHIVFNSIYTGEHVDARILQKGWNSTNFNDDNWVYAMKAETPDVDITPELMHPIRDVEELQPIHMVKISDTCYVYDFGKNMAGVCELNIRGNKGCKVYMKHAERIDENYKIDMSNIDYHYRPIDDSDPFQTDVFILSGSKNDTFRPLFNYKGFQYVEISSTEPISLSKRNIKAHVMCSDVPQIGKISSSNQLLNKIWEAANRSYLSNLFGYPTDCPQREKNGWTGDAHIAIETGLYNYDAITIYEKWMRDHEDEQRYDGRLPAIIPTSGWGYDWGNGVDWVSSVSIVPWTVFLFYGDTQILESSYITMQKYVDYMLSHYPNGITDWGLGDWIPIKTHSSKELTSSIYYYVSTNILSNTAKILGKEKDADKYRKSADKIKNAINERYLNKENGLYGSGSQTELSMALYWDIVPSDIKEMVSENLAKRVNEDSKLDVGLLGSKSILNALSDNGYADLAYDLAVRDTYPSWGWWIKNGATTLYENWNIEGSKDISLNHIMFGEVNAWFYKALGGIYPDESNPGFEHIVLRPNFVKNLDKFEAKYLSPYGEIISSWRQKDNKIIYEITIPSNCTATWELEKDYKIESKKKNDGATINNNSYKGHIVNMTAGTYKWIIKK